MRQEKNKTIICWIITVLYMAVIFWFSSRTSDESSQQSSIILEWLINYFGNNGFTDFIVRKSAHFLEFAGLAFLLNISLYQTKKCKKLILSAGIASVYAMSDEIHQIFVEGRSCQISDWALDTCGVLFGTLAFVIVFALVNAIYKRKSPLT